ncbi:MAG: sigma-70 family RNA polymerase sigma factor [bacterium]|nr:sigma-70 family RNA polymerase sigma factor [bacterium]
MTATAPRLAGSPAHPADAVAETFVRQHQRGLWRWLRALGCEADHAEEHCQDALLAGLAAGAADWPRRTAASWLRTAARNLFLMRLRQQRRRPDRASLDAIAAEWQALDADADGCESALQALRACVRHLPARGRELLEHRYGRDESRAAMAKAFGLREAGVKQALRRLRDRLRDCLNRRLGTDPDAPPRNGDELR